MTIGFYELVRDNWDNIAKSQIIHRYGLLILIVSIFFGFIQPFMMSTYPYQLNNHEQEQLLIEWMNNNINKDKYVFENWVYFSYLAELKSDYKVPVLSDATFYYLTSVNNSFTDYVPLRKNVYENTNYDTVIYHEPIFNDLFLWIGTQFDEYNWNLIKTYNLKMSYYNDDILFWYPGFKISTFDYRIDIWTRKPIDDLLLQKNKNNYSKENIEKSIIGDNENSIFLEPDISMLMKS